MIRFKVFVLSAAIYLASAAGVASAGCEGGVCQRLVEAPVRAVKAVEVVAEKVAVGTVSTVQTVVSSGRSVVGRVVRRPFRWLTRR